MLPFWNPAGVLATGASPAPAHAKTASPSVSVASAPHSEPGESVGAEPTGDAAEGAGAPGRDEDAAGLIVNPLTAVAMFDIVREDGADSFIVTAAGSQLGKFLIGLGKDNGIGALATVRRADLAAPLKGLGADIKALPELDAATIAALVPNGLAQAVADELHKRLGA